jgi:phage terminase large subunit
MMAHTRYVAFGGARGGGKSWATREKAKRLALKWPGIKILIIRQTYADLRDNHINPLAADLPSSIAPYREVEKSFIFTNGSRIKCSYFATEKDALQYQGQEYDVIFLEEATQFTEKVFIVLTACLRGANAFPKRIYLTCNPDGIGFLWVKRLFVSRIYKKGENPEDYTFIQSLVTDNKALLDTNPEYIQQLDALPDDLRKRWRYGSWDVAEGQYFGEFDREVHVCDPFPIPKEWRRYRAFDYGLDMLACYWIAVDSTRTAYVYRELCRSDLPITTAARAILDMTDRGEEIYATLAPPDLWSRSQETGRGKVDIFYEGGLALTKSSNDREAGWLSIKELLKVGKNGQPRLKIFSTCPILIDHLPSLQRDPKKSTDTLTEPHEITHSPDALRYFSVFWHKPNNPPEAARVPYTSDMMEDYYNARTPDERERIIKRYGGLPQ